MLNHPAPRVSVICIFFNAERYFEEAIDSVLAQTFADFELILADDGSQDSSTAIAKAYAERDARVRYVQHDGRVNRGMSATRNLGIGSARGEFIAFIDADDVWTADKLADQVAVMERHGEVAMVCGKVRYWRSWYAREDRVVASGPALDHPLSPPDVFLSIYPLGTAAAPCPSDLLLRTSAVREVGGFEAHFTGRRQMYEDQGFLAKIYLRFPVYFDSRCWLWYRQHEDSCVSEVKREGGYDDVRSYYLSWLEGYLQAAPGLGGLRERRAVRLALDAYRRPRLHAARELAAHLGRLPARAFRKAARLAGLKQLGKPGPRRSFR